MRIGARRVGLATVLCGALALPACAGPGDAGEPAPVPPVPAAPAPGPPAGDAPPRTVALNQHGVNAGHPLAAQAGMEMLEAGGTAADAAVAAAFAVSVVEPYASGVGGGGAALVATQVGAPEAFDYREVVAADGVIPPSGTGIPGFVAGMAELHAAHGTLEWSRLLEPAARLAEQGVPVTDTLVERLAAGSGATAAGLEQFAPGGSSLQVGDTLVQADLGATFRELQARGPQGFYTGAIAEQLTAVDGIDVASLARYDVQRNEPVRGRVGDAQVVSSPPALTGAALIQMLQALESQGIAEVEPDSTEYLRRVSEAWLLAERTVRTDLGDLAFTDVPVAELVDPARNAALAAGGPRDSVGTAPPAPGENLETPGNTTHLTVVDGRGTVVSMTNTLTEFWGSGTEVGGFFVNDQLSRFDTVTSGQNRPEAGRRSVTWSNPTLVLDAEGRPLLGIGTPGGENILNILGNALTRRLLLRQSLDEAVTAPRFRFDSATRTLAVESALAGSPAARGVGALGWQVSPSPAVFGSIQALEIDYRTGTVSGPTDTRLEAGTVVADAR